MEFSTKPEAFSLRSYMFYIEFPPKETFFCINVELVKVKIFPEKIFNHVFLFHLYFYLPAPPRYSS